MVEGQRDESEAIRTRVEINEIVLTRIQNAVEVRENCLAREETRERIEVEKFADARYEIGFVGVSRQASQVDHAPLVLWRCLGFRIVYAGVGLPVRAEILEQFVSDRLEQRHTFHAELFARPRWVRVFDEHIEAKQPLLRSSFNGEQQPRERRARRRYASFAKELVSQCVTQVRKVG